MSLDHVFKKCAATLIGLATGIFACVVLSTSRRFQRHIFYFHKAPIWWGQKLDKPESSGFLHNQVLPLRIPTSDGESLYAWLVSPLALYARNERAFLARDSASVDNISIRLLRDPESRLVIYFHGNAGSVGQERRTDAYRMISSGLSQQIHVLSFDYRGFARSSGSPSEVGLIDDALSVIKWATTVRKVPSNRIVLLAQSLGTAVASGAVDALLRKDPSFELAGLMLCAAFPDAPTAILSYKILGHFTLLGPLNAIKPVRKWFFARFQDRWDTKHRISRIVSASISLRLTFFAAENDEVIDFNTETLFYHAVQEALGSRNSISEINNVCQSIGLGDGGTVQEWEGEQKLIKKVLVSYGGHNGIMKWAPVALEVIKCFNSSQ
ncbi:alpha/beta-hydrolase [Mytilinidion resinicola]|uniref:Alpha/beta-hydrolase n=1 Tax=Mytilinidion resinicola TaxID=574789 RepID=A0A6A6YKP0_9PEZI|nr:alpha/beta-hydrolase [Mytilinidion resinicola]KAF2809119.1 alpha/beta-hydrolase [Mytilinidion resinicola]